MIICTVITQWCPISFSSLRWCSVWSWVLYVVPRPAPRWMSRAPVLMPSSPFTCAKSESVHPTMYVHEQLIPSLSASPFVLSCQLLSNSVSTLLLLWCDSCHLLWACYMLWQWLKLLLTLMLQKWYSHSYAIMSYCARLRKLHTVYRNDSYYGTDIIVGYCLW